MAPLREEFAALMLWNSELLDYADYVEDAVTGGMYTELPLTLREWLEEGEDETEER